MASRLSQITQLLESKKAAKKAEIHATEAESQLVKDLALRIADDLNATVNDAVVSTMKAVDLQPIIDSIASNVPETDLGPLQKAIADAYSGLRSTVMAECNRMIKAIPKVPEMPEPDFGPVLNDLQWLKSFLALKKDIEIPEPREVLRFDVVRNQAGFIERVNVEYKD